MSTVKESVYKGHPTLSLGADEKYPFTFGVAKAKLIVENIESIKAFVAKHDPVSADRFDMAVEDDMARRAGVA